MFEISNEAFDALVEEALDSLPEHLISQMDNVAVVVDDESTDDSLFGLYEGIPLTERGPLSYDFVMPDRITLFKHAICRACASAEDVRRQVRITVVHEVGHHFGIDDERLDELGWS